MEALIESNLPLKRFKRGKVRDIYDLDDKLLIVSTDRISAFDSVLPNGIPRKGEALNRLSAFWFNQTEKIIPNHMIDVIDQRSMLVRKAEPIKIEFIVRGYLYGSAFRKYKQGKKISGIELPEGLKKAEKLPSSILTPTTKAEQGHDVEVNREQVARKIGNELTDEIEEACFKIYEKASKKALKNGILIADTKFEFGLCGGDLIQIDETLTPDSSRFWPLEKYELGKDQYSFDKQYLRDYLDNIGWNKEPPAPNLPDEVIAQTSKRYKECYERLTGKNF
ncbi:phosphoribosylaminoimidazole-succinocarboxamide synthase [candidate division MSBL1 archaeon SCGC-AAA261F19]|uniref:Phosphoribosylaminoimidazole-succinocarboxamide synthase n=2 Tax=candidate division MSBL1 TaxID=215777 RepID=A0A133V823_9EURY|nr:phosphoribosylaminoimidazole-succinocarboxamide synthase [candidate division MSBL1 archaeon SCGC-AAA261F19]KXB02883.1 phosphoribosylaminoimidazole-succinocarboxamide synthase [candidate division MSBL1 archaeon SCGC-AAA261D19]